MKIYFIIIGLIAFSAALPATACRCVEPDFAHAYKKSTAVIKGVATDVINAPEDAGITAVIAVSKSWKKNTQEKIAVNSLTSCYFPMSQDQEYILFLYIEPNGLYSTSLCSGNKTIENAKPLLEWLETNTEIKPPVKPVP